MKVIDLLNKIANGEVKERQRFVLHFKNGLKREIFYRGWESEKKSISSLRNWSDNEVLQDEYDLDDTVEIIEEEPEIDIQGIEELQEYLHIGDKQEEDVKDRTNIKINELIKAIKQLDKKLKEGKKNEKSK